MQDALVAATHTWPRDGIPDNPRAWLVTAASRRYIDHARADTSRRRREQHDAVLAGASDSGLQSARSDIDGDDALQLLFLCCQGSLSPASQIALTLRAVGGLTTAAIAHAFFVPEATMAQRISRAKRTIAEHGATFEMPPRDQLYERLRAVEHTLYLIFNEGYTASAGPEVLRVELTDEAIRFTRQLRRLRPGDDELAGLLALMLLTDARRPARLGTNGELVSLAEQNRSLWNRDLIGEGVTLVEAALAHGPLGPYQLQAAIAAVHDGADTVDATDWHANPRPLRPAHHDRTKPHHHP